MKENEIQARYIYSEDTDWYVQCVLKEDTFSISNHGFYNSDGGDM